MPIDHQDAWNTFWNNNAKGSEGGGCLPDAWRGIAQVQAAAWAGFARRLDRGARVLDMATGDGRVMACLLKARRDLKPMGIDLAPRLPSPPRGTRVRGGVSMEAVPQPDRAFAALTSQFGFEYGDIAKVAAEIARLVRPGGWVGLMTHRLDGPIVAHNRRRHEQIRWAIDEEELPEKARNSLRLRAAGLTAPPAALTEAPTRGEALHGEGSAAWEIAEAIRQTLVLGRNGSPAGVAATIDEIVAQARNELGRIASLEAAAEAVADSEKVSALLAAAGLDLVEDAELHDPAWTEAFADFRIYKRRG